MLETGKTPTEPVVKHLDRCLTCLSCMTTCPSGVHYAHLIEEARVHIENTYTRPRADRLRRRMLAAIVPNPMLFRLAALAGRIARPLAPVLPAPMRAMLTHAPRRIAGPSPVDQPQVIPAEGERRLRVALLTGCAQQVLRPGINEATVRVLTRHGCEVVIARGGRCCGAILHQLELASRAKALAKANITAWLRELDTGGLDAVVYNASGCGVAVRDYGHLLRDDPDWAEPAARIAALGRDVTEILLQLGLKPSASASTTTKPMAAMPVTYHAACTMQHGLRLRSQSQALLTQAGFAVREPAEAHICCGSAGTYSVLQPEISDAPAHPQARSYRGDGTRDRRHRQHRLHHASSKGERACRSSTRSNCWIGQPAAQSRRISPDRHAGHRLLAKALARRHPSDAAPSHGSSDTRVCGDRRRLNK